MLWTDPERGRQGNELALSPGASSIIPGFAFNMMKKGCLKCEECDIDGSFLAERTEESRKRSWLR